MFKFNKETTKRVIFGVIAFAMLIGMGIMFIPGVSTYEVFAGASSPVISWPGQTVNGKQIATQADYLQQQYSQYGVSVDNEYLMKEAVYSVLKNDFAQYLCRKLDIKPSREQVNNKILGDPQVRQIIGGGDPRSDRLSYRNYMKIDPYSRHNFEQSAYRGLKTTYLQLLVSGMFIPTKQQIENYYLSLKDEERVQFVYIPQQIGETTNNRISLTDMSNFVARARLVGMQQAAAQMNDIYRQRDKALSNYWAVDETGYFKFYDGVTKTNAAATNKEYYYEVSVTEFYETAFSTPPGVISAPIDLGSQGAAMVYVIDRRLPDVQPLSADPALYNEVVARWRSRAASMVWEDWIMAMTRRFKVKILWSKLNLPDAPPDQR